MIDNKELLYAKQNIYDPCNFNISDFAQEEGAEYSASSFRLNSLYIKFRSAKITPTKNGLFVTLWKRNSLGITQPYEESDLIDLVVIHVRKENQYGQFVFPKDVLTQKEIFSTKRKEGKRGFRVYPSWDTTTSKQAERTQKWQLNYFMEVNNDKGLTIDHVKKLYQC